MEEQITPPEEDLRKQLVQHLKTALEMTAGLEKATGRQGVIAAVGSALEHAEAVVARMRALANHSEKPSPVSTPEVANSSNKPFTILVVEDDPVQRRAMAEILSDYFQVLTASDGAEGAVIAQKARPDVILSDLRMPNADGFTLLAKIAADLDASSTPLLILSAHGEIESKIRAFELGAFDYLTKPIDSKELIARVRNALARAHQLHKERALQWVDELTGLSNRRRLKAFLASALRQAMGSQTPLSVVGLDQDGLKGINDRFGHAVGDQAIRRIAEALRACARSQDCAARVGGDEFLVVMPSTGRAGAETFANRVRRALKGLPLALPDGAEEVAIEVSIGIASVEGTGVPVAQEKLLDEVDQALYRDKRERRRVDPGSRTAELTATTRVSSKRGP